MSFLETGAEAETKVCLSFPVPASSMFLFRTSATLCPTPPTQPHFPFVCSGAIIPRDNNERTKVIRNECGKTFHFLVTFRRHASTSFLSISSDSTQ